MDKTLLYLLALPSLSACGGLAGLGVFAQRETPVWVFRLLALLGLGAAAVLVFAELFDPSGLRFGFVLAVMCVVWVAGCIALIESFFQRVKLVEMMVFPVCALVLMLPWLHVAVAPSPVTDTWLFRTHLLIAVTAYSVLGLAALHAGVMVLQGRMLHNPGGTAGLTRPVQERLLDQLPPLLGMESTLFRQIWLGFGLLSLTLFSGVLFSIQSSGHWLSLDHKTLFSVVSWVSFLVLLVGRVRLGWRGKRALRWCLGGYAVLVLAYFGTQFVSEFLLR